MAKSKKSKKSKRSVLILAVLIILVFAIISIYPDIISENTKDEDDKIYTVTFINGGSEYAVVEISSGNEINGSMPNRPAKEGYSFVGWNTDKDGKGATVTEKTIVNENMTVYAIWSLNGVMSGNGYTSTAEQSYKVSENLVKIELVDLDPSPNIEGTTITLYNPSDEKRYHATFSSNEYTLSFEGLNDITMEFNDADQDGIMDDGEELLIMSESGFYPGIWNIEMRYDSYIAGNVDFRFHIFEEGIEKYDENVRISVLDVGQADSILVFTSDGKTVLIDAGVPLNGKTKYVPLLLQQLHNAGVEKIDVMILTHPDYDHIAGATAVLEKYEVGKVYTCKEDSTSQTYLKTMAAIDAKGIERNMGEFEAGDYLNISTTEAFRVLSVDAKVKAQGVTDANAASIALRMSCASTSVLFTGDIPSEVEQLIIAEYPDELNIDILKVAHHGSRGSSCEEFLQASTPIVSIISCGEGNKYGHPHEEALERLETYSLEVMRTDISGIWTYSSAGKAVT